MFEADKREFELLPRQYYKLEHAARIIGCNSDYLLHLGATGRLELLARIPPNRIAMVFTDEGQEGLYKGSFHADFFTLFVGCCSALECEGSASIIGWDCLWQVGNITPSLGLLKLPFDVSADTEYHGSFCEPSSTCIENESPPEFKRFNIAKEAVFISSEELSRINSSSPSAMSEESKVRVRVGEFKPLAKKTENKLHQCIAALAILFTKTACHKPHEAAKTIHEKFLLNKIDDKFVTQETLASYIKQGVNELPRI